jgi:hypothetical protein
MAAPFQEAEGVKVEKKAEKSFFVDVMTDRTLNDGRVDIEKAFLVLRFTVMPAYCLPVVFDQGLFFVDLSRLDQERIQGD